MDPIQLLKRLDENIRKQLEELCQYFDRYDRPERLEKSKLAFNAIQDYLSLFDIAFRPHLASHPDIKARIIPITETYRDVEEVLERASMLHVDEPDDTFREKVETLRHLWSSVPETTQADMFTAIQNSGYQPDADRIAQELKASDIQIPSLLDTTPQTLQAAS